jgi:hypothetical protein
MMAVPKWKRLLDKFEAAVRAYAWIGGAHPTAFPDIEQNYVKTKAALVEYLSNSIQKSRITEHEMGS